MIRFDLTTLRIFLAVYNLNSLTKAAEHEHIAPSAVSKRLNDLETDLKVQLFHRHPRGVSPTRAGDALARHARVLFECVNDMAADLSAYSGGEKGEVRIHGHSSAMNRFLPHEIASFSLRYPDVRVLVREESTPNVIQSMQDGVADLGLIAGHVAVPRGLSAIPWREDRLVAAFAVDDPLAARASITFDELANCALISLESGSSLHALLDEAARALGVKLNNRLEVTTLGSAVSMAAAGLGVAIVPSWVVETAGARIASVRLDDNWAKRRLSICVRSNNRMNASVRLMLDHLIEPCRPERGSIPNR